MKVTFIHHSCFCVEIGDRAFVFDYFRGDKIPEYSFGGKMPEFPREKEIYVCASHQHRDHFDLEVLSWKETYPNIRYILSKDIRLGENYLLKHHLDPGIKERVHVVKSNDCLELDGMKVETLASTDAGVAFLVTYEGEVVYHAGDLNWWHWEGEDPLFHQYQEKTYKRQIDRLRGRQIDTAFVVMDPRLGEAVFWGIDYFMEQVQAKHVVPMHLWQQYDLVKQYRARPESEAFRQRIAVVEQEKQVFVW